MTGSPVSLLRRPTIATTLDPLTEALDALRIDTTMYAMAELAAPWGVGFPASAGAYFHVVKGEPCWLTLDGPAAVHRLGDGDVVLLPHGSGHRLTATADGSIGTVFDPVTWTPRRLVPRPGPVGGPTTELVCGAALVRRPASHPLLAVLPGVVLARAGSVGTGELLATVSVLHAETRQGRPGVDIILARLGDVLMVQVLRIWAAQQPPAETGWLAALSDPAIGAAVTALHADPAAPWTVARLATVAGLSRSRFAERFAQLVGRPPLTYLADWRLTRAAELLTESNSTVREVGRLVGFTSEPAFSRAFSRHFGVPPSRYRRAGARSSSSRS
jgi:AraC-like DNA-binding protein